MDSLNREIIKCMDYIRKMMHLSKFIHTHTGKILMSVLLGFGLATFFRKVCVGKQCIIYNAPPTKEIDDQIFKHDNACYKYTAASVKCDASKKIVEME